MAKKVKAIKRSLEEKEVLKIATGRPTKYDPSLIDKFLDYFDKPPYEEQEVEVQTKSGDVMTMNKDVANDMPTLAGFAILIGVDRDTLKEWAKVYPDFSAVYKKAKDFQENFLVVNGLRGLVQQPTAIFALKNLNDWRDKRDVEFSGNVTSMTDEELDRKLKAKLESQK